MKLGMPQQKLINLVLTLLALAASYITGSLAIDTASLWLYFTTLLLLGVATYTFVAVFRRK